MSISENEIEKYRIYSLQIDEKNKVYGYFGNRMKMKKVIPFLFNSFDNKEKKVYELFYENEKFTYLRKPIILEKCVDIDFEENLIEMMIDDQLSQKGMGIPIRGTPGSMYNHLDNKISYLYKSKQFDPFFHDILLFKTHWNYITVCLWFKKAGDLLGGNVRLGFFKNEWNMFKFYSDDEKFNFLQLHRCVPDKWKKYFKSTKEAYNKSIEFFEIGKKNKFGYSILAKDGHTCNSLAEAQIDDYLSSRNMSHEKEPHYPGEVGWRADFKYKENYIEYFGLKGQKDYDKKTQAKLEYGEKYHLKIIPIYPNDMKGNQYKKILDELR